MLVGFDGSLVALVQHQGVAYSLRGKRGFQFQVGKLGSLGDGNGLAGRAGDWEHGVLRQRAAGTSRKGGQHCARSQPAEFMGTSHICSSRIDAGESTWSSSESSFRRN
jgi:hypothetical protein